MKTCFSQGLEIENMAAKMVYPKGMLFNTLTDTCVYSRQSEVHYVA